MFPLFRQERFDDLQESPTIQNEERMERWDSAVPSPQAITRKSLMLQMSSAFYEDRLNGATAPHFQSAGRRYEKRTGMRINRVPLG